MTERNEILKSMKKIEDYFQRCSQDNELFKPEFECARAIRHKVESVKRLTTKQAKDVLKIYNEANAGQHYDGSGWKDYQLHLRHLLTVDTFKIEIELPVGRITISA